MTVIEHKSHDQGGLTSMMESSALLRSDQFVHCQNTQPHREREGPGGFDEPPGGGDIRGGARGGWSVPALPRGLHTLQGRHAVPGAGGQRAAPGRRLLPGALHGCRRHQYAASVPLPPQQGEDSGASQYQERRYCTCGLGKSDLTS